MSPRSHLTKARLVQAAANLLNAEGVRALSLNRLADELGIRTPSLYNHIDGLPGLMRELSILNAHNLAERLSEAAIGQSGPALAMSVMQAHRSYIKEYPGLYLSTLRSSGMQEEVSPALEQEEARSVKVGTAVMTSFGLQGEDAIHAVRAFRSIVHGFATLEVYGGFGLPLDLDESFIRLVNLFIAGLQESNSNSEPDPNQEKEVTMGALKIINLAVRFLLEICVLICVGYWGFKTHTGWLLKILFALGGPLLIAVIWGMFAAPKAAYRLQGSAFLALEVLVFGSGVAALFLTKNSALAWVFAVVLIVNKILIFVWRQ